MRPIAARLGISRNTVEKRSRRPLDHELGSSQMRWLGLSETRPRGVVRLEEVRASLNW
jgi:hypothetical protein